MPPAKRSPSGKSASSSSAKRTASAAKTGAKATASTARKAAAKTTTQAKAGTTRTRTTAKAGASKTARSAKSSRSSAAGTAKTAGGAASATAKTARSGARTTAKTAATGARSVKSSAKGASTRTRRASGSDSLVTTAEQLLRGMANPRDLVMLTRDRIQETLDDAAARGRVTSKDANELVGELVRRGRSERDDLIKEIETLLERGRGSLETATKRARGTSSVDRVVRGADRARRTVGVGSTFPIMGYDDLTASQVQSRIKELKKPELRKVLTYERKHANRKSVIDALEKSLA